MRVIVVDDEALARDRLVDLLEAFPDVEIVAQSGDGEEALRAIGELHPDVVFLDIEMPGCNGLDVARSLGAPRPKVVFCTGYDQYAVDAFEVHASDYLLKPVTRARLARSIERLRQTSAEDWNAGMATVARALAAPAARFLARSGSRYRVVAQADVDYFASEDGLTALHAGADRYWMEPTLGELEEHLDQAQFFRVSRSAIVRLDAVFEIASLMGGYGEVELRSGARLQVSRRRFRALLERIGGRSPREARPEQS